MMKFVFPLLSVLILLARGTFPFLYVFPSFLYFTSADCAGLTSSEVSQVLRKTRRVVGSAKPAMVRLTFHDCVGGCDGCLNLEDPDNAGLEAGSTVHHSTIYI